MAIRLSKNISSSKPTTGFDLTFSANTTYDLDEIIANRNRKAGDRKLLLQIKDEKVIGAKILDEILTDVDIDVKSELGTSNVREKISNIIQAAYAAYPNVSSSDITNKNVIGFINFNLNKYVNSIWNKYSINYTVEFKDYTNITISYQVDSKELNKLFIKYYEQYAEKIQKELENVEEGGLAISNEKKVQINPSYTDYQKYLLDEEKSNVQATIGTGNYRTIINWEDYTEDDREQEDVIEIPLDILNNYVLKEEFEKHISNIQGGTVDPAKD